MILRTWRLILDPWQSSDWTAFRPIAQDAEVMRYITGGAAWSDEQIRGFVDRQVKLYGERGFCRWKLMERSSRELVGFCGVGFWREAGDRLVAGAPLLGPRVGNRSRPLRAAGRFRTGRPGAGDFQIGRASWLQPAENST